MLARSTVPSAIVTGTSVTVVTPYRSEPGVQVLPGAALAVIAWAMGSGATDAVALDAVATATPHSSAVVTRTAHTRLDTSLDIRQSTAVLLAIGSVGLIRSTRATP